ncbi:hypothetical protein AB0J14_03430 [Micromonospora arborensis]
MPFGLESLRLSLEQSSVVPSLLSLPSYKYKEPPKPRYVRLS